MKVSHRSASAKSACLGDSCGIALGCIAAFLISPMLGCDGVNIDRVIGQQILPNTPPSLTVTDPNEDKAVNQGDPFSIAWVDADPDDNARISITLIEVNGIGQYEVAGDLFENDSLSPDRFVVDTTNIVEGAYFIRVTISDGVNDPIFSFAQVRDTGNRARLTITPAGQGQSNSAPRVVVTTPRAPVGISQNDILTISVRPTTQLPPETEDGGLPPDTFLYDSDGDTVDLYVVLDLNDDPTDDDPSNDDDTGLIVLGQNSLSPRSYQAVSFNVAVNVQDIPIRRDGLPYYVRATVSDGLSTTHSYATGTVHVLELVQASSSISNTQVDLDTVRDLGTVGRTLAGARFVGFNAHSHVGSKSSSAMDLDNDGISDFVLVAQYGDSRNRGNLGEAYLVYGLSELRFGGEYNVNSIGPTLVLGPGNTLLNTDKRVRGTVFWPPSDLLPFESGVVDLNLGDDRRIGFADLNEPYTLGITDVIAVPNLTAPSRGVGVADDCQLPELLFGLPHNEYMASTRDSDPADNIECPEDCCTGYYAYPDDLSDNFSSSSGCAGTEPNDPVVLGDYVEGDIYSRFYQATELKQGSAVLWYGENSVFGTSGADGDPCTGLLAPSREVVGLTTTGSESSDEQVNYGAMFGVAIYDKVGGSVVPAMAPFPVDPLNAHFGMTVDYLEDIDDNGLPELIISAPRNEIESTQLLDAYGDRHPHLTTRFSAANINVYLGQDFSFVRASGLLQPPDDDSSHIPFLASGSAAERNRSARSLVNDLSIFSDELVSPGWFYVRGANSEDKLGQGASAGDFNNDGLADIMAGAPFYDPLLDLDLDGFAETPVNNGGAVYVIYNRFPFGNVELALADQGGTDNDPNLVQRPPMVRIFGESDNDNLGLRLEAVGDINGDGVDDVLIASKNYDRILSNGNRVVDAGFVGVVFGDQRLDEDRVVSQLATSELPGVQIYGANAGDWAGADISPAGDFNGDGTNDLLITAPGVRLGPLPNETRRRMGAVYLIFGGRHLSNRVFALSQVGSAALPGIVFAGPYEYDTPESYELDQRVFVHAEDCDPFVDEQGNLRDPEIFDSECFCDPEVEEGCVFLRDSDGTLALRKIPDAAPLHASFIGDINADGHDDVIIGNPTADLVDPKLPGTARRPNTGEAYLIYGNGAGLTVN